MLKFANILATTIAIVTILLLMVLIYKETVFSF